MLKPAGIDARGVGKAASTRRCQENVQNQNCCQTYLENEESVTLEVMIWLDEWIDREKFLIWCGQCEAKNGTEINELLQAGAGGLGGWQGSFRPRKRETGRLKDKKEESRGKTVRGFYISLKSKVSWRKKDCGNLARENVLQDRGEWPKEERDVIRES